MINNNVKTAYSNAVFLSDGHSVGFNAKGVAFGNAVNAICEFLTGAATGDLVVLTDDAGYFSIAKNIRAGLTARLSDCGENACKYLSRLVIFSVDDGGENMTDKLLESVNTLRLAVIGGGKLLSRAIRFFSNNNNTQILAVPVDYSFAYAMDDCGCLQDNLYLFFDDVIFSSLQKNKVADVVRSVLSKRILFAEMRVNRLIGLDFDEETIKKLINESILFCGKYFSSKDYKQLVYARLISLSAVNLLPFSDTAKAFADLLACYDLPVMPGEREYLSYKILAKVYSVVLSSQVNLVKVPSFVFCRDELLEMLPDCKTYNPFEGMPDEDGRLTDMLRSDEKLNGYVAELTQQIPDCERVIYLIYGGRKHSVEDYPSSVKAQALRLAPLLINGGSLIKAAWCEGYFESL